MLLMVVACALSLKVHSMALMWLCIRKGSNVKQGACANCQSQAVCPLSNNARLYKPEGTTVTTHAYKCCSPWLYTHTLPRVPH